MELQGELSGWGIADDVAGGLVIAQRIPLGVDDMLGEHSPQLHLPGLGTPTSLFATPSAQFLLPHRHARSITNNAQSGDFLAVWRAGNSSGRTCRV